ncbi:MAG: DUF1549 domain-containing protein [Planctomycetota bacterium]|nr:DUF1549 domain-containing protein [Planctomycetota bacterium]
MILPKLKITFAFALCFIAQIAMGQPRGKQDTLDFAHQIVPILKKHCVRCHGGEESQAGLSLNTREHLIDAGLLTEDWQESELNLRLESDDPEYRMPPEGDRPTEAEIKVLQRWLKEELPWEPGFTFAPERYEPPLRPRKVTLPPAIEGRTHPIDRIVDHYFETKELQRPRRLEDEAFLRRVTLDLTGLLPTRELRSEWLDGFAPSRSALISQLLSDDIDYAEHWLTFWNDLLRNDYSGTGFITGGRKQITRWLYQSLVNNKPYDQMVRELLVPDASSEGFIQGIRWRGVVSASQRQELQFAQNVSQAFLGINLKCASCHDSFIDRWTLEETYALAQVYATEPLEQHRCDKPNGKFAKAAWLFPELGEIDSEAEQRARLQQLSKLMTTTENGRFARTIANRIWHRLMGRGIVHPVDAMHTKPWNEDLLEYLANYLVDQRYDLKKLLAHICQSETYQAVSPITAKEETTEYLFTGPTAKRMSAEQFVDCVWQLTDSAPPKHDSSVDRFSTDDADSASLPEMNAQWIWTQTAANAAPGGESPSFRKLFEIQKLPEHAVAAITCDNEYRLFINGQLVAEDKAWESVERVDATNHLRVGDNTILIVAKNGASTPNPAGLCFELLLAAEDGQRRSIATDDGWQFVAAHPRKKGKFTDAKLKWQQAAFVSTPGIWQSRIEQLFRQQLSLVSVERKMVRASLLKADELMRALGRPNRDQIVTMRPNGLTTLEAIQLANGQRLADALSSASTKLQARFRNEPEQLVPWLCEFALTRKASESELQLAQTLLGQELTTEAIEDLLWSFIIHPEFQLIR